MAHRSRCVTAVTAASKNAIFFSIRCVFASVRTRSRPAAGHLLYFSYFLIGQETRARARRQSIQARALNNWKQIHMIRSPWSNSCYTILFLFAINNINHILIFATPWNLFYHQFHVINFVNNLIVAGEIGRARRGAVPDVPRAGADAQRNLLQVPGRVVLGHLQRHRDARHQLPRSNVQPGSAHRHSSENKTRIRL